MNLIEKLTLGLLLVFLFGDANAEQPLVFSKASFVNPSDEETIILDGNAWRIQSLPSRFCPINTPCPAIIIDGKFRVGDKGEINSGNVGLTAQQLGGQPLWIYSGAKVKVPAGAIGIAVQEYVTSYAPVKPAIPLQITYRQSMMGNGLVTVYTNKSDKFLKLLVTVKNPKVAPMSFRIDLAPNETKELGHLEGWTFNFGDQITVTGSDEYEPLNTWL